MWSTTTAGIRVKRVKGGIDTLQALFKVKVHNAFRRLNYCPDLAE